MPPLRFLLDENKAQGIAGTGNAQAGVSDVDDGSFPESSTSFPWLIDPATSWLDYRCGVEVSLDAGMVLHKPLPQSQGTIDTIASSPDVMAAAHAQSVTGVNTISANSYTDIAQRMATSTYRFALKGYGLRVGYQVPVPALKAVAGITPVPDALQWSSGNILVGNYGGIPVYLCEWELHYFVTAPPKAQQLPPPNIAEHIRADDPVPSTVTVPYSQADMNSVSAIPAQQAPGFFVGGGGQ